MYLFIFFFLSQGYGTRALELLEDYYSGKFVDLEEERKGRKRMGGGGGGRGEGGGFEE